MYDDISVHITLSHQWEVFSRLYLTVEFRVQSIGVCGHPQITLLIKIRSVFNYTNASLYPNGVYNDGMIMVQGLPRGGKRRKTL